MRKRPENDKSDHGWIPHDRKTAKAWGKLALFNRRKGLPTPAEQRAAEARNEDAKSAPEPDPPAEESKGPKKNPKEIAKAAAKGKTATGRIAVVQRQIALLEQALSSGESGPSMVRLFGAFNKDAYRLKLQRLRAEYKVLATRNRGGKYRPGTEIQGKQHAVKKVVGAPADLKGKKK